jgi:hypothetical protein
LLLLLSTNQNKRRRDGKGSIYNTKIRFHGWDSWKLGETKAPNEKVGPAASQLF